MFFLPDSRIILTNSQRRLIGINELTRPDSICYLAIINNFSIGINNSRDKVIIFHINEINIKLVLTFQNKIIFLGYAHNSLKKEATNMLVFLASSVCNYQ